MSFYPVLNVTTWETLEEETAGSKQKVWLVSDESERRRWLFKYPRSGTGEHWAEKVAAEVATILRVPHARVELARRGESVGCISLDFTEGPFETNPSAARLMLGNEVLSRVMRNYAASSRRPVAHTIEAVLRYIALLGSAVPRDWESDPRIRGADDVFLGYLLLDAWIGNSDRHHENWGWLVSGVGSTNRLTLAPSFDHASSLGREQTDARRRARLETKDRGFSVEAYCARGESPIFSEGDAKHPLSVRNVFRIAMELKPAVARAWIDRLAAVDLATVRSVVERVPDEFATPIAKRFAIEVLFCNHKFLVELEKDR